jgi:hypothetical protein
LPKNLEKSTSNHLLFHWLTHSKAVIRECPYYLSFQELTQWMHWWILLRQRIFNWRVCH